MAKISKTAKDIFVAAVARSIPTPEAVSEFQTRLTELLQQALIELQPLPLREFLNNNPKILGSLRDNSGSSVCVNTEELLRETFYSGLISECKKYNYSLVLTGHRVFLGAYAEQPTIPYRGYYSGRVLTTRGLSRELIDKIIALVVGNFTHLTRVAKIRNDLSVLIANMTTFNQVRDATPVEVHKYLPSEPNPAKRPEGRALVLPSTLLTELTQAGWKENEK